MAASVLDRLVVILGFKGDYKALREFQTKATAARRKLNAIGTGLIGVGAVGVGATVAMVKSFADFETELAKIEGLVGISRSQLDAWKSDILAIGKETAKGPAELASALFFVTSAGYRGQQAIDILRLSAMASTAGLGDLATVADLLTSALDVYKAAGFTAAQATDQLTAAVRLGKIEPEELASSIASVLPFAQELGVTFGQVAGAQAAMSKGGITARRSAVALRGIFAKLLKPTEQGKKALAQYGLTVEGIREQVGQQGILPALQALKTAFGDNSDAMGMVFEDQEALLGVLALTDEKYADAKAIIDEVTSSTGILDEAFKTQEDTLNFKWGVAMSRAQGLMITFGEKMAPVAEDVLDMVEGIQDWADGLSPAGEEAVVFSIKAVLALGAVGLAAKALALLLSPIAITFAVIAASAYAAYGIAKNISEGEWGPTDPEATGILAPTGAWLDKPDWFPDWFDSGDSGGARDTGVDAGAALMGGLAEGITANTDIADGAMAAAMAALDQYLPHSDARLGPLSNLTASGRSFMSTFATGMQEAAGMLPDNLSMMLEPLAAPLPVGPSPAPATTAGDRTITVTIENITIEVEQGDPEAIASGLGETLDDQLLDLVEQFDSRYLA